MYNQNYQRGVAYVILAGVFLSMGGLFIRFIESADAWTVLFYRSLAFTATVCLFMYLRDGASFTQRFKLIRPSELVVSVSLALGFITFVLSIYATSVANTVLILSTGPVFAALLAWLFLRERVSRATLFAMLLAFAGVAIIVSKGLSTSDKLGVLYAFVAVTSFSIMIVALRCAPDGKDMLAPTALAGIFAAIMALAFIPTLSISFQDLLLSIALGSLQIGLGFILITLGSRTVPAAQVPLLALAETALSPLWVWLFVDETPARNTTIGGILVLLAVAFQGYAGLRKNP